MKLSREFDKDKLFFTSDLHLFHDNIIKYCNRPFANAREMNEVLIDNWNRVVLEDGVVFNLGDVSLGAGRKDLQELLYDLNGEMYLCIGNHESDALKSGVRSRFVDIQDILEIYIKDKEITYGEQHIVMCHYPMIAWNASHRGSWQLFGHVHGGLSNKGVVKHSPAQLDVGVDCHRFEPISYQTVKEIITKQFLNK